MADGEKMSGVQSRPLLGVHIEDHLPWSEDSNSTENLRIHTRSAWSKSPWRRAIFSCSLVSSLLLNTFLLSSFAYQWSRRGVSNPIFPQLLYCMLPHASAFRTKLTLVAPVNNLIKYNVQKFTTGFGNQRSKYQAPPSEQKDKDWEDLYVEAFTIPKEQAAQQPNKTVPVSDAPDAEYITSFSVMHFLHCLDMVRRGLDFFYYPDYSGLNATHNPYTLGFSAFKDHEPDGMLGMEHLDHCVDALRQALTCQADLSPVVWQWDRRTKGVKVWAQTVHTCRNYDELKDWAREREWTQPFEQEKHLEPVGKCGGYETDCDPEL